MIATVHTHIYSTLPSVGYGMSPEDGLGDLGFAERSPLKPMYVFDLEKNRVTVLYTYYKGNEKLSYSINQITFHDPSFNIDILLQKRGSLFEMTKQRTFMNHK